jgi:transposase
MMHPRMKWTYVGCDSHKDTHTMVFLDCFFGKIGEITFNNIPGEFEKFLQDAQKFKVQGTAFAFGMEDFSAYGRSLTVFLTGKKQMVKHVNAALVASERKSGNILQKTDAFDALCAARVLITRFDDLPVANPQDKFWVLGSIVARRNALVKINGALKNQLHALLTDNYPNYRKYFPSIATRTALMFFEKYPSPLTLTGVTAEELTDLFKHITNNRFTTGRATEFLTFISKCGFTASEYQEQKDFTVMSTVRQISANLNEINQIDKMLADFLKKFDYKLTTMRGIDTVIAAKLIAEIGDIKRFESPAKLAKYSGIAPVTYASGKSDCQYANTRGNRNLNEIFFRLALTLTMTSGRGTKITNHFFYDYYRKKLSEGKTKKQALKSVQRRLVNIIWVRPDSGFVQSSKTQ